jgi:hypothetical protein
MGEGRLMLGLADGKRTEYPILEARLSTGRSGDACWLMVVATARLEDWTPDTKGPEALAVEILVRVDGPEPAAWVGREFEVPEERDERTGCYPAWLYDSDGYETLGRSVVSVGDQDGAGVGVRVVGRGTLSGRTVEVVGTFHMTAGGDASRG